MNKIDQPKIPLALITEEDVAKGMINRPVKIKLTKLSEAPDPLHPNNIKEGECRIGYVPDPPTPKVGSSFTMDSVIEINGTAVHPGHMFMTSEIQEIINPSDIIGQITFRTLNSVYKIELL